MATQTACPDESQLRELLDGRTTADGLAGHVETCEACRQRLDRLAGGRTWSCHVAGGLEPAAAAVDAALQQAMDRLKCEPMMATILSGDEAGEASLDFLTPSARPGVLGTLGQYDVTEVVGRGAFGIVLKAFDPKLHRFVAIKVLAPQWANNATARRRFLREAQAAAAVSHDHVVAIYAVHEDEAVPYLVMEYIGGVSLQEHLDRHGPLDVCEILRIGMQAAAGLAAAHRQGLIHRDIKPGNILLENGVQRVKITDFGLARAVDDVGMTQTGVVAGTPLFMSPEQACGGPVDSRADLFSLGSVLYSLCTGRSPFRADTTMAVLRRVCEDAPRPIREVNPDIPEWLCAIIDRLLAKHPDDRLSSADELADLLGRHLAHLQQPATVPAPPPLAPLHDLDEADDTLAVFRRVWRPAARSLLAFVLSALAWVVAGFATLVALYFLRYGAFPPHHQAEQPATLLLPAPPVTEAPLMAPPGATGPAESRRETAEAPPTTSAGTPDRRALEWLLSVGGSGTTNFGGNWRDVADRGRIPDEPFMLVTVLGTDCALLDDEGLTHLRGLKGVRSLFLSGTSVTDAGLRHVAGLTTVQNLHLERTSVTDAFWPHIADMKELRSLWLRGTDVRDLSPLQGRRLKQLTCDPELARRFARTLQAIPTLVEINGRPAAEFWKSADAAPPDAPSPASPTPGLE